MAHVNGVSFSWLGVLAEGPVAHWQSRPEAYRCIHCRLVKRLLKIEINLLLSLSNCCIFEFRFQSVGRSNLDIHLTALCRMSWFVCDDACMDCCRQWPLSSDTSVALLKQFVCSGGC